MSESFFERNRQGMVILLVFAAIVAFVLYWRLGVEDTPGDYYVKKGNYRLEDGQFERAEEEFGRAIEENPDHVGAHLGLAISYMQTGRNEEAVKEFTRVIELKPDHAVAHADRGILYDRMGRYEKALQDYNRALELDPSTGEGPGWIWRFMRNIDEKPPTIADRAAYLKAELQKPPEERLLRVPELDEDQRMYKK